MQSRGGYGTISVEVNEMVVGLTMMKLARRKSTKARNTHTGQLDKILREAMEEREARDPDIDRERTKDNEYLKGYGQAEAIRSGDELARLLEARADRYGEARRAAGGRGVREDAGIGLAMIIKPPADEVMGWPPGLRAQFFRDAEAAVDGILGAENCVGGVVQRDEPGEHEHRFYAPYRDGTLDANAFCCPDMWRRLNTEFPAEMRRRGWDGVAKPRVDDPELYDPERAAADPEYLEARREKKRSFGRQSRDYKAAKDREKRQEAARMAQERMELERREKDASARERALEGRQEALEAREVEVEAERQRAKQEADRAERLADKAKAEWVEAGVASGKAKAAQEAMEGLRDRWEAEVKALSPEPEAKPGPKGRLLPRKPPERPQGPQEKAAREKAKPLQEATRKAVESHAGAADRVLADAEWMAARDNPTKMSGYDGPGYP